jgi:hypothetical protein
MSVINFPGGSGPRIDPDLIDRAVRLKQKLVRFATRGPMAEAHQELLAEHGVDASNFQEFVEFTDWFIFEWADDGGRNVIDELLDAGEELDDQDRVILDSWQDAFSDLFDIVEVRPEGFLLADDEGERYFAVPTSVSATEMGVESGMSFSTRLVPLGEIYLLSGAQEVFRTRGEAEEQMREEVEDEVDRWFFEAFVSLHGPEGAIFPAGEVPERLLEFGRYAVEQFRPNGHEKTLAELAQDEGVSFEPLFEAPQFQAKTTTGNVGFLMDADEGPAIVPHYDLMLQYLRTGEGDEGAMASLLVDLLEDPAMPPFVIRRLAEAGPQRFSRLVALGLDESDFDATRDLDDLLEDFKGNFGDGGDEEEVGLEDLFDDSESTILFPEDLGDVRTFAPERRPEGSIAAACAEFLASLEGTVKEATLETHVLGVNMLARYAWDNDFSEVSQIDENFLLDFLAVWYPRTWGQPSASGAKQLLTTVGKLTSWLDATRGGDLNRRFKTDVAARLKDDLPRVVKAATELGRALPTMMFENVFESLDPDDPDSLGRALGALLAPGLMDGAVSGMFSIVAIDGNTAHARRRAEESGEPADDRIYKLDLPPSAAGLLRSGDLLVAVLHPEGDRWAIRAVLAILPPAAG